MVSPEAVKHRLHAANERIEGRKYMSREDRELVAAELIADSLVEIKDTLADIRIAVETMLRH